MMPLFFHAEAHLWIVYALFVNGILFTLFVRQLNASAAQIFGTHEALLVTGLLVSLLINAGLFLIASAFGFSGASASSFIKIAVVAVTVGLCLALRFFSAKQNRIQSPASTSFSFLLDPWMCSRFIFYALVALLLFYNGALIEQVSDAWWHLSLANTLSLDMSTANTSAHLIDAPGREYPMLWHINLAVLKLVSSHSLPELFNAATPWLAIAKLMAFFLIALGLTNNRAVATIAVALYIFLPGLGASYLRVSAWPSHVSYTAWFFAFFVVFRMMDNLGLNQALAYTNQNAPRNPMLNMLRMQWFYLVVFLLCVIVIYFTHKVELVWLFVAMASYLISLLLLRDPTCLEPNWSFLHKWVGIALAICVLFFSIYLFFMKYLGTGKSVDFFLVYSVPILLFSAIVALAIKRAPDKQSKSRQILAALTVLVLLAIIDWQHLASAFYPESAYPTRESHEWALLSQGWFGGTLLVPGWHLQLRSGLIYSGILSVPIAWCLAWLRPSRATLFLVSCGTVALLLCISPYLYTWFRSTLSQYHSSWRVALIIFHPIVYAVLLHTLFENRFGKTRVALMSAIGFIVTVVALSSQSSFHFSPELVTFKRNAGSAQRHWNLNYGQNYVFYDSSFRYTSDLTEIAKRVPNKSVVLADLATSYYVSAYAKASVVNVHRHHGVAQLGGWRKFNQMGGLCGAIGLEGQASLRNILADAVRKERVFYIFNKDRINRNVRSTCEGNRAHIVKPFLTEYAKSLYDGGYLVLYEFVELSP
ncbi:MAG: hypothetical protein P8I38_07475 [Arenicella sp.]|jgi:hypothetical protein|nr:hypothetical protein [Arenicella sp.]